MFGPVQMRLCDRNERMKAIKSFRFDVNGADQLVDIIIKL
jgi:hypothetical protein